MFVSRCRRVSISSDLLRSLLKLLKGPWSNGNTMQSDKGNPEILDLEVLNPKGTLLLFS